MLLKSENLVKESRCIWQILCYLYKRDKIGMYRSSDYQTNFEPIGLSVQIRKLNKDFQQDICLGFSIRNILAIFDLKVTSILLMQFPVNWQFGSR